jgi:L-ascorbate metabolism protein UlaG (beta-lactamase superfamily)
MRVTYLGHSGFLAEWGGAACVFDFTEGTLPPVPAGETLLVFVSHAHGDHFSPRIFSECAGAAAFVLSNDVPKRRVPEGLNVVRVSPGRTYDLPGGLTALTTASTDAGVSFLVRGGGKSVYHAGDLNWWSWPDDAEAEARDMRGRFLHELKVLAGTEPDAAFLPLDGRLGGGYARGFDEFMRALRPAAAFPMHQWGRYGLTDEYLARPESAPWRARVRRVERPGQVFEW